MGEMYVIDTLDRVMEVHDAPLPDSGASLPFLMSDENHLLLAYMVSEFDEVVNSNVRIMTPDSKGYVALVEFSQPFAHMCGPPNDETFLGHPLAERGLRPYGVFEVLDSSWIRQLEAMNKRHSQHSHSRSALRHYIFSFHDSTFECIAQALAVNLREGSVRDAMFEMLQRVQGP
jgi:hypothetical protein